MSKKDYIRAAQLIKRMRSVLADDTIEYIIAEFATLFAEDNPRFDRARFIDACGGL